VFKLDHVAPGFVADSRPWWLSDQVRDPVPIVSKTLDSDTPDKDQEPAAKC
jgi:hypothetical protein